MQNFDDLSRLAGLRPLGATWVEFDEVRARRFLVDILRRDLAYGSELAQVRQAEWLAAEFLVAAGPSGARYATNSPDMPHGSGFSWTPASDCTFDAGVAVIGEAGSAIYWVADED